MSEATVAAANKLRQLFDIADRDGYGKDAWYSYMSRRDIEVLIRAVLEGGESVSDAEKDLMAAGIRQPVVVVDWDGTCVPSAWPERPRKWLSGAVDSLRELQQMGFKVKIHSVRTHSLAFDLNGPNEEQQADYAYIRSMLDSVGLKDVDIIMDDKPPAIYYIDDRAIRYDGSWESVMTKIEYLNRLYEAKHDAAEAALAEAK